MKGVSEVVAMVMMLVITLALAGTAYVFISGAFTRQTQGIEIVDAYCTGSAATITFRNIGTQSLASVTTTRISGGSGTFNPNTTSNIAPGALVSVTDNNCGGGNLCTYRLVPSAGRPVSVQVQCT